LRASIRSGSAKLSTNYESSIKRRPYHWSDIARPHFEGLESLSSTFTKSYPKSRDPCHVEAAVRNIPFSIYTAFQTLLPQSPSPYILFSRLYFLKTHLLSIIASSIRPDSVLSPKIISFSFAIKDYLLFSKPNFSSSSEQSTSFTTME
jgi:hypothetical protein